MHIQWGGVFFDNIMEVKYCFVIFSPDYSKIDGGAGGDSGVLLSAQTITSESVSTTTTTHITKVKQSREILGLDGTLQTGSFLNYLFVSTHTSD